MFDLMKVPEPLCVSVMREGQMVCVSVYSQLPDGYSGEAFYGVILDMAMQRAAELSVGLVIDGGHEDEGQ